MSALGALCSNPAPLHRAPRVSKYCLAIPPSPPPPLHRMLDGRATHVQTGSLGTPTHAAPELLREGRLCQAVDVYAFGVLGGWGMAGWVWLVGVWRLASPPLWRYASRCSAAVLAVCANVSLDFTHLGCSLGAGGRGGGVARASPHAHHPAGHAAGGLCSCLPGMMRERKAHRWQHLACPQYKGSCSRSSYTEQPRPERCCFPVPSQGARPPPLPNCPPRLAALMEACWQEDPQKRWAGWRIMG